MSPPDGTAELDGAPERAPDPLEHLITAWRRWDANPGSEGGARAKEDAVKAAGLHSGCVHVMVAYLRSPRPPGDLPGGMSIAAALAAVGIRGDCARATIEYLEDRKVAGPRRGFSIPDALQTVAIEGLCAAAADGRVALLDGCTPDPGATTSALAGARTLPAPPSHHDLPEAV